MHEIVTADTAPVFTVPFINMETGAVTDPTGVTVSAVDAAGDTVSGWSTSVVADTGVKVTGPALPLGMYRVALAGEVDGAAQSYTIQVESIGGHLVNPQDAKQIDPILARASWTDLIRSIAAVDQAVFEYVGWSMVQRQRRFLTDGSGVATVVLPDMHPTVIVSAETLDADGTWTAFTSDELADVYLTDDGAALRRTGVWPRGIGNVRIVYQHGWYSPPVDLEQAFIAHIRHELTRQNRQSDANPEDTDFFAQVSAIPAQIRAAYDEYRSVL